MLEIVMGMEIRGNQIITTRDWHLLTSYSCIPGIVQCFWPDYFISLYLLNNMTWKEVLLIPFFVWRSIKQLRNYYSLGLECSLRQQCSQVGLWGEKGSRGLWSHQWMDHDRFIIWWHCWERMGLVGESRSLEVWPWRVNVVPSPSLSLTPSSSWPPGGQHLCSGTSSWWHDSLPPRRPKAMGLASHGLKPLKPWATVNLFL